MFPIQDNIPSRHPPTMITNLIIANVVVFVFESFLPKAGLDSFVHLFGVVPARFTYPEWAARVGFPENGFFPFFTTMFLHGGLLHIFGNMWFLWIFGDNVEDRMGPYRFLFFYLFCGLAASITHVLVNPDSTMPIVGASGAIAGVMGAYLMMYPHARVVTLVPILFFPFFFDIPAFFYLFYWLILNLFSGVFSLSEPVATGGVAFWAHLGGFVTGAATFWMFLRPRSRRRQPHPDQYGTASAWISRR